MRNDQKYLSADEFLAKMDTGALDFDFSTELSTLSNEQLEKVCDVLVGRVQWERAR